MTNSKIIVLAVSKLRIGGAEQIVVTLAKAFKKLGYEPHIILLYPHIELPVPNDIPVHIFNYQKYRKLPRFLRFRIAPKVIDNFILTNIGTPLLTLSNLESFDKYFCNSNLPNVFLIVHNTLSKRYKITNRKLAYIKSIYLKKPCVGVSEGVTKDFEQLFGIQNHIVTINNFIDKDKIEQMALEFLPEQKNYLVNVGNFKPAKRHDRLITAYANANIPNPLILVGDGSLRPPAEALVKQLGIESKVHFIGKTDNPYPYIKNALAMVISSDVEGLSISMLEAIGLGIPVISTACPSGPPEVLPARNLTELSQDLNDTGLSQLMIELVNNPSQFAMGLNNDFLPEVAAQKYVNLIKN